MLLPLWTKQSLLHLQPRFLSPRLNAYHGNSEARGSDASLGNRDWMEPKVEALARLRPRRKTVCRALKRPLDPEEHRKKKMGQCDLEALSHRKPQFFRAQSCWLGRSTGGPRDTSADKIRHPVKPCDMGWGRK